MLTVFVLYCALLAAMAWAGWWARGQRSPVFERGAPGGFELEVFAPGGRILWQRFSTALHRDEAAALSFRAQRAVLARDPGEDRSRVLWGEEQLEEWESVWPR